jgi:hypothetical protein
VLVAHAHLEHVDDVLLAEVEAGARKGRGASFGLAGERELIWSAAVAAALLPVTIQSGDSRRTVRLRACMDSEVEVLARHALSGL